jgi:hypothetical protein
MVGQQFGRGRYSFRKLRLQHLKDALMGALTHALQQ